VTCVQAKCIAGGSGSYFEPFAFVPYPESFRQRVEVQGSGLVVRDDFPDNVYLIRCLCSSRILVCVEFIASLRDSGATGIYFEETHPMGSQVNI
jgi:hypothetical protein